MARLDAPDSDRSFNTSHKRTRQINYADILDTQIRRIMQSSFNGEQPKYIQAVDDMSEFLTSHKDAIFRKDMRKINEWKDKAEKQIISKEQNKTKQRNLISQLQFDSKHKVYQKLLELISRGGFFPPRFIETDIDIDPEEEMIKEQEKLEGKTPLEDVQWRRLLKIGKELGIKDRLKRKDLIEAIKSKEQEVAD